MLKRGEVGHERKKGEEKREKKGMKREGRKKKCVRQGGARWDVIFFSFKLSKLDPSGIKEEKPRKNRKASKFLLVGKLIFMFFKTNALIFLNGCEISGI